MNLEGISHSTAFFFWRSEMDPLLLDIPREIRTPRLILRVPAGDGTIVLPTVLASLPELIPWMPWATDKYDLAAAESWCRKAAGGFILRKELHYLILLAGDHTHVGALGLFAFDWLAKKGEIGYWLATPHQRHGYMTEAVNAITQLAFDTLGLTRVEIGCGGRNLPSQRVAERCGYVLEGIHRNARLDTAGLPSDHCVYAKIRSAT
jgi:ribosomal-protein-serine acetyltransferase